MRRFEHHHDEVVETAAGTVRRDGYAHLSADAVTPALVAAGLADWDGFAASWDRLEADTFMNDGGRYRRRRHAVYALRPADAAADGDVAIERRPDRPHLQSLAHNRLNGGIERRFAPVEPSVGTHKALRAVLLTAFRVFERLAPPDPDRTGWLTEIHQFRIAATDEEEGRPTPEGAHRDGVDWVLVMMVNRSNVSAGETTIADPSGRLLGSFTLAQSREIALVDDGRCLHGVTAVRPLDPSRPAYRDVLVVTLKAD